MPRDNVNEFLAGGGAASAKFETKGTVVKGTIIHFGMRQQSDFKSGKLLFWDDGNPRMQVVITLQTDERDDDEDDGRRSLYVKGNMLAALRKALGKNELQTGGTLAVKYTGDGEKKGNLNAPKLYACRYEAPVQSITLPDDDSGPF